MPGTETLPSCGVSWPPRTGRLPLAAGRPRGRPAVTHPLALLSRRAVEYGAALGLADPRALADRLYRYNSLPLTAAWRRRVPDERAAARLLGLDRASGRAAVEDDYRSAIWQVWDAGTPPAEGAVYKLYLSPRPLDTAEACRVLRSRLGRRDGPFSVKVAADPASLLRPDRLVGYFASRDALLRTARALARRLGALVPQGVPFTTPIGRSALLSWSADPPADLTDSLGEGERSWRGWVTLRLAEALVAGGGTQAAMAQLGAHGVDIGRWVPPWA